MDIFPFRLLFFTFLLVFRRRICYIGSVIPSSEEKEENALDRNAEYDSLCAQRNNTQSQINSCNDRIENYDYLLRRLRTAKGTVSDLKSSFKKTVKNKDEDLFDAKRSWEGQQKDSFLNSYAGEVEGMNRYYYNYSIDHVLDSLNNEITRIENLRLKEYGLLGELGAALNSLINRIENFFN